MDGVTVKEGQVVLLLITQRSEPGRTRHGIENDGKTTHATWDVVKIRGVYSHGI